MIFVSQLNHSRFHCVAKGLFSFYHPLILPMSHFYDVTDEQWKRIQPLLPPEYTGKKGRPRKDNRTMLNGMLWMNHSGAQWRQLPERYGPWQSVYARFAKWRDEGIWEKIFSELTKDADTENLSIDSTCIKVHESSNGGKKNRR